MIFRKTCVSLGAALSRMSHLPLAFTIGRKKDEVVPVLQQSNQNKERIQLPEN